MSDVEMPEMNGFALARSLRQTNGDALYLIAWTANDQAGVRAQAKQAGFNSFAVKPLDFSELRTLLDSVG